MVNRCFRRIIEDLDSSLSDACLEFKYRQNPQGYSRIKNSHKSSIFAHRFAYCWHNGVSIESIDGLCVMHSCDNPCCINPKHLVLGTWAENNRDRADKGRSAKNLHVKRMFTPEDVRVIRRRYSPTRCPLNGVSALARDYNVDTNTIYQIVRRKTYRDII